MNTFTSKRHELKRRLNEIRSALRLNRSTSEDLRYSLSVIAFRKDLEGIRAANVLRQEMRRLSAERLILNAELSDTHAELAASRGGRAA